MRVLTILLLLREILLMLAGFCIVHLAKLRGHWNHYPGDSTGQ